MSNAALQNQRASFCLRLRAPYPLRDGTGDHEHDHEGQEQGRNPGAPRGGEGQVRVHDWAHVGAHGAPYQCDESHQHTNDDADPQATSAGQGVAAADAQQRDDDGATPEAILNEEFKLGDNGADKEQRRPDQPAPPPGAAGLMTVLGPSEQRANDRRRQQEPDERAPCERRRGPGGLNHPAPEAGRPGESADPADDQKVEEVSADVLPPVRVGCNLCGHGLLQTESGPHGATSPIITYMQKPLLLWFTS
jgi:hypothetical protein